MEKKLAQTVARIESEHPSASVQVWATDEHRLGLQPLNRIIWVAKGEQPIAEVNWKYQWLWLVGFVHPRSGQTYWWLVPFLNTEVFSRLLADFARHFQLCSQRRILLVLDRATFHRSRSLRIPEGLDLCFLPAKSPELQPAERLWPLTNEPLANRTFVNLDELEEVTAHRCRQLLQQRQRIHRLTYYHWWPEDSPSIMGN